MWSCSVVKEPCFHANPGTFGPVSLTGRLLGWIVLAESVFSPHSCCSQLQSDWMNQFTFHQNPSEHFITEEIILITVQSIINRDNNVTTGAVIMFDCVAEHEYVIVFVLRKQKKKRLSCRCVPGSDRELCCLMQDVDVTFVLVFFHSVCLKMKLSHPVWVSLALCVSVF